MYCYDTMRFARQRGLSMHETVANGYQRWNAADFDGFLSHEYKLFQIFWG